MDKQEFVDAILDGISLNVDIINNVYMDWTDNVRISTTPVNLAEQLRPFFERLYDTYPTDYFQLKDKIIDSSSFPTSYHFAEKYTSAPPLEMLTVVELGNGQIFKNGVLVHEVVSTYRLKIGITFKNGSDILFIKFSYPDSLQGLGYDDFNFGAQNSWYLAKVWMDILNDLKTNSHPFFSFCNFFGIPKDNNLIPYSNVSCSIDDDDIFGTAGLKANQYFFIPYNTHGSGKAWFDAEVAVSATISNALFSCTLGQYVDIISDLVEKIQIPGELAIAVVADSLAKIFCLKSFDCSFFQFYARGASSGNQFYTTSNYVDGLDICSLIAFSLVTKHPIRFSKFGYPDVVVTSSEISNWLSINEEILAKGGFITWKHQSSFLYLLASSLTVESVLKQRLDISLFNQSLERSFI